MDKIIIFGRVYSFFSPKKNQNYFKIDYLTDDGESCSDFITQACYYSISSKNFEVGTLVTAHWELNQYNRGEIVDCTTE